MAVDPSCRREKKSHEDGLLTGPPFLPGAGLTLIASTAYSTWKMRPSGEKVFTPRSYSLRVKNIFFRCGHAAAGSAWAGFCGQAFLLQDSVRPCVRRRPEGHLELCCSLCFVLALSIPMDTIIMEQCTVLTGGLIVVDGRRLEQNLHELREDAVAAATEAKAAEAAVAAAEALQ